MSDLLARATRELRDAPVAHERALLTLARVSGPRSRRRSRRLFALVLPVAATLVAIGAWAGAAHERSRAMIAQARTEERVVAHAPTQAPKGIAVLPPPSATETAAPLPQLPPPATVRAAPPVVVVTATVTVTAQPQPPPPPSDTAGALYRTAFEAYRDHDDAAALAGWDAYLAAAGATGRFVPEARFARAATLLRLGRKNEAREALAPFARGDFGTYRQTEARALLQRL